MDKTARGKRQKLDVDSVHLLCLISGESRSLQKKREMMESRNLSKASADKTLKLENKLYLVYTMVSKRLNSSASGFHSVIA